MKLSQIHVFPVKSLAGFSPSSAQVLPQGLENDRQMMLVDEKGIFISQRKHPQLAQINLEVIAEGWLLQAAEHESICLTDDSFSQVPAPVKVWQDSCQGLLAKEAVNDWFSLFLGQSVKLVRFDQTRPRAVDPLFAQSQDTVGFADGFPLLLTSQGSLDELNRRLEKPVKMQQFRPNLVVEGLPAYVEDGWRQIKIGSVTFDLVKPCSRCVLITVDPQTGVKDPQGQPLKTLSQYRRTEQGVMFGMNMIPRNLGEIRVGDLVEVLA